MKNIHIHTKGLLLIMSLTLAFQFAGCAAPKVDELAKKGHEAKEALKKMSELEKYQKQLDKLKEFQKKKDEDALQAPKTQKVAFIPFEYSVETGPEKASILLNAMAIRMIERKAIHRQVWSNGSRKMSIDRLRGTSRISSSARGKRASKRIIFASVACISRAPNLAHSFLFIP